MSAALLARWAFALLFGALAVRHVACAPRPAWFGAPRRFGDPRCAWSHALTAAGMVAMFLPLARPVPHWWWAAGFALNAAWLAGRIALGSDRGALLVRAAEATVMSVMFAVMPAALAEPHAGHLAAARPAFAVLGWLAAAGFLAHALRCGVRVAAGAADRAGGTEGAARMVMSVGMTYMLLAML